MLKVNKPISICIRKLKAFPPLKNFFTPKNFRFLSKIGYVTKQQKKRRLSPAHKAHRKRGKIQYRKFCSHSSV